MNDYSYRPRTPGSQAREIIGWSSLGVSALLFLCALQSPALTEPLDGIGARVWSWFPEVSSLEIALESSLPVDPRAVIGAVITAIVIYFVGLLLFCGPLTRRLVQSHHRNLETLLGEERERQDERPGDKDGFVARGIWPE